MGINKTAGQKKCKACGEKTNVTFNINFKATPICDACATRIFLQQATWLSEEASKHFKTNE